MGDRMKFAQNANYVPEARLQETPLVLLAPGGAMKKNSKHRNERAERTAEETRRQKPGVGFWLAQMLNASSAIIPIPTASTANATGS